EIEERVSAFDIVASFESTTSSRFPCSLARAVVETLNPKMLSKNVKSIIFLFIIDSPLLIRSNFMSDR
ncbi:hypothetical protein A5876_001049, partial [Enterococcus sp. 3C8_DIV0646]